MTEFFATTITSLLLIAVGIYGLKFPPKKINYFYGYRTRRSMANQTIWDFANKIGSKMIFVLGIITLILSLVMFIIFPKYGVFISILLVLIGLGVGLFWCETKISRYFDQNGNPKSQN